LMTAVTKKRPAELDTVEMIVNMNFALGCGCACVRTCTFWTAVETEGFRGFIDCRISESILFCPIRHLLIIQALVVPISHDVTISFAGFTLNVVGEILVLSCQGIVGCFL